MTNNYWERSEINYISTVNFPGSNTLRTDILNLLAFYHFPAEYNLTIEKSQGVTINTSETTIPVKGGETKEFTIIPDEDYKITSIKKITTKDNGTGEQIRDQELLYSKYNNNVLTVDIEDDSTIKDVKIVVTTRKMYVTNAKEFQEALGGEDFATVEGNVVTLKKDVVLSGDYGISLKVDSENPLTLDLNGKSISVDNNFTDYKVLDIQGTTNLTIKDSSTNQEGKINISDENITAIEMNSGILKIDGGNFIGGYVIYCYNSSSVTINNGDFKSTNETITCYESSLTINNGKFTSEVYEAVYCLEESNVVINGGEFIAENFEAITCWFDSKLTIKGGTFISKNGLGFGFYDYSIVSIVGGSFEGTEGGIGVCLVDGNDSSNSVLLFLAEESMIEPSNLETKELYGDWYNVTAKSVVVKTKSFDVTYNLGTSITSNGASSALFTDDYKATLTASAGYKLPEKITVKVGGTEISDYTYNSATGEVVIKNTAITGNIEITAEAVKILEQEDNDAATDNKENPSTGDNIILYVVVLGIAVVGIIITIKVKKHNKNNV